MVDKLVRCLLTDGWQEVARVMTTGTDKARLAALERTTRALAARVEQLERERIEAEMREGYIATRADREELNADWGAIDFEGWPD